MLEGDSETAKRIVDVVLAHKPANAEALRLRGLLRAIVSENAGIPAEALGDLRLDARHLEWESPEAERPRWRPAPPLGVAIIVAFAFVFGVIGLIIGLVAMLLGEPIALVALPLGALQTVAGIGLWRLRPWAWYLSVVALGLGIVLNVVGAAQGSAGSALVAFVQLVILVYLTRVARLFLGTAPRRARPMRARKA